MSEEDAREDWNWKGLLVVGCTVGALLGAGLAHGRFLTLSNATANFFGASPENTLRILQSVGILLPLVVGLFRFTTSDRSEVSERLHDHLLLGILGLVLAGASAVVAGMFTGMIGVLKLSLLFVLFTFIVIGLAAGALFGEFTTGTGNEDDATKDNERDATQKDDVNDETETQERPSREEARDVKTPEAETEAESASNEEDEQAKDITGE